MLHIKFPIWKINCKYNIEKQTQQVLSEILLSFHKTTANFATLNRVAKRTFLRHLYVSCNHKIHVSGLQEVNSPLAVQPPTLQFMVVKYCATEFYI